MTSPPTSPCMVAEPETPGVADGRVRVVIEAVAPAVHEGRFAIRRAVGDVVLIEADCFADGHDKVAACLIWRKEGASQWHEAPMRALGNDRWSGSFIAPEVGRFRYSVIAWVDHFQSWQHDLQRRLDGADILIAAQVGAELIVQTAQRAGGVDRQQLLDWAESLRAGGDPEALKSLGLDPERSAVAHRHPDRRLANTYATEFPLVVERTRARFSTWYELFPRSAASDGQNHGTFADVMGQLPVVADMGFDVVYFPPIHPIGLSMRKGPNNTLVATPDDVGSPWAIGSREGGHKDIHPALGSIDDFRSLRAKAASLGVELAMDIAYQCAPDHPYVETHPEWFRSRPDGSIQYAENPPKKYQDIFPFDFECDEWQSLWQELASVLEYWAAEGIRIFRVDNPHTKAFPFWEWALARLKHSYPDLIFLAEAFTRPKVMHRLAKLGFTQSYTYFTWRNTKDELTAYFTELTQGPGKEYFWPNVWPNTPDILPEYLQLGGRPAFMVRLALAATLAANYGIYGPAFELLESSPREPGSEEYLNSEKYQIKHWRVNAEESLRPFITRINEIRHANPALQSDRSLRFLPIDNTHLIAYVKSTDDLENVIVCAVNLDPYHTQSGWLDLDLSTLKIEGTAPYQMHELLTGARYLWTGSRNFISLDVSRAPVQIFRLRRKVRSERDFDYFL